MTKRPFPGSGPGRPTRKLSLPVRFEERNPTEQMKTPVTAPLAVVQFDELWEDVCTATSCSLNATAGAQQLFGPENNGGSSRPLKDLCDSLRSKSQLDESKIEALYQSLPRETPGSPRADFLDYPTHGQAETFAKVLAQAFFHNQLSTSSSEPEQKHHKKAAHSHHSDDRQKDRLVEARHTEIELNIYRQAEDWVKVREIAQKLKSIDPTYFDLEQSHGRFETVNSVLQRGLVEELDADEATNSQERFEKLCGALGSYNHGCFTLKPYHEQFDGTESMVHSFDESDWANMFSSAARICYYLSKEGYNVPPRECSVRGPKLAAQDWEHQAFHFLEQGRTRALLDSIIRGNYTSGVPRSLREINAVNMDLIVEAAVKMIRKRRSLVPSTPTPVDKGAARSPVAAEVPILREPASDEHSTTLAEASEVPSPYAYPESAPPQRPCNTRSQSQPSRHLHPLTTEGLAGSATPLTTSPSNILTPEESEQDTLTKWRVNMRWRKAVLFALAQGNPTLNAVYDAALSFVIPGGIETMRSNIPPDTLIIEYAMTTTAPRGIMTVVAASDGVKAIDWKEADTYDILQCIKDLRSSMGTSETRTIKPRSPAVVNTRNAPMRRPSLPERRKSAVFQSKLDAILRHIVLPPVRNHLKGKKNLVIVPSGELAHVPWTIFFDLPITVVPSLDIWRRLQARAPSVAQQDPRTFIISNAPEDKENAKKGLPYSRDIPYSRIEALYVAKLHNKLPFLADEKDRKTFRTLAKGTQVLHIGGHATFEPEAPMSSSLHIFKEPLTMLEWHTLSIQADLVVFSSCLSAIWRSYTLLSTGTRAFIGSLWPVDDAATLLLMIMFYEELRRPLPAADALYAAQKRMRGLTESQLHDIIDDLEDMMIDDEAHDFVVNPQFHIDELRELDAMELRDEKYWAAFVLTGYGASNIYPSISD